MIFNMKITIIKTIKTLLKTLYYVITLLDNDIFLFIFETLLILQFIYLSLYYNHLHRTSKYFDKKNLVNYLKRIYLRL